MLGLWGATNDTGIQLMSDNGFMTERVTYVHAATLSEDSYQRIAASGASASVSTESEQSAGQGYPPTWMLRRHRIPISLSMDTSVWWSGDLFSAMRATLSADRSREHLEAHAKAETIVHDALRGRRWSGGPPWRGGGNRMGDVIGSLAPGKKADVRTDQERRLPGDVPYPAALRPCRLPGGPGDVHTVMVNGRIVKSQYRLVGIDLAAAKSAVDQDGGVHATRTRPDRVDRFDGARATRG